MEKTQIKHFWGLFHTRPETSVIAAGIQDYISEKMDLLQIRVS